MLSFLFKQKTAYEMRISDWSSDVCSSDLVAAKQGRAIENALAEGKSVLVARETVFNPLVGFRPGSIFGGDYRPPLTYWLHRDTQSQLVLGSSSAKEEIGRASCRERVCQFV